MLLNEVLDLFPELCSAICMFHSLAPNAFKAIEVLLLLLATALLVESVPDILSGLLSWLMLFGQGIAKSMSCLRAELIS